MAKAKPRKRKTKQPSGFGSKPTCLTCTHIQVSLHRRYCKLKHRVVEKFEGRTCADHTPSFVSDVLQFGRR